MLSSKKDVIVIFGGFQLHTFIRNFLFCLWFLLNWSSSIFIHETQYCHLGSSAGIFIDQMVFIAVKSTQERKGPGKHCENIPFQKTDIWLYRVGAKVGLQLWVCETVYSFIVYLLIIIFHTNNYKPACAPTCILGLKKIFF